MSAIESLIRSERKEGLKPSPASFIALPDSLWISFTKLLRSDVEGVDDDSASLWYVVTQSRKERLRYNVSMLYYLLVQQG